MFAIKGMQDGVYLNRVYGYQLSRIDRLANVIIGSVMFALLILPVVAMYVLARHDEQVSPFASVGVLIAFTLIFCAALHGLTRATQQEVVAASAAYCAVLVVFVGQTQTVKVVT